MSYFVRTLLLSSLFCALFFACTPPEYGAKAPEPQKVSLDLRNPKVQHLFDLRDKRQTDSLRRYLTHPEATLRYLAALSFASLRDSNALDALNPLLSDPSEDVRIAAAFSMGQSGSPKAEALLLKAFDARDSLSRRQRFNATVLESIGKCGTLESLKNMAAVSTYKSSDTLLMEGLCRAIYRFGLRGIIDPAATSRMVSTVFDERNPAPARLYAAHYLARAKDIAIDSAQAVQMASAFVRATNQPDIRMALAKALGRSVTGPAFGILSKVIHTEEDWRVKCQIINALAKFDYDTVRALVSGKLLDANPHVSRTAAEFFTTNGQVRDADYYWRITRDRSGLPLLTQIALFRASNKLLSMSSEPESKEFVNYRLKEIFQQSKNPYERAACIAALAEFGWNYKWIRERSLTDAHPAVKTAAAEALLTIAQKPNFYGAFGEGAKGVRRDLYYYIKEMIMGGDAGMIAASAEALKTEALNYKTLRDSARLDDFKTALGRLKMPRDVEAYMALDKVIAWFEGRPEPAPYKPSWNNPIDWERLKLVTPTTEATIETGKGNIVLSFYPESAPGSTANFLALAAKGDYNGRPFHRVVPNFVIQGGCPRGDGYGALDYTIRTEIGLNWYNQTGFVGMASAGFDTEGTQFFITHSPTPHLDGGYTLFGVVKSGMDVVHQIQPGDVINKVTVKY